MIHEKALKFMIYQISIIRIVMRYIFIVYLFGTISINIFTSIFAQNLVTSIENASKIIFFRGR